MAKKYYSAGEKTSAEKEEEEDFTRNREEL